MASSARSSPPARSPLPAANRVDRGSWTVALRAGRGRRLVLAVDHVEIVLQIARAIEVEARHAELDVVGSLDHGHLGLTRDVVVVRILEHLPGMRFDLLGLIDERLI